MILEATPALTCGWPARKLPVSTQALRIVTAHFHPALRLSRCIGVPFLDDPLVACGDIVSEADHNDLFERGVCLQESFDFSHGNARRPFEGKAIGACADRGEGDAPQAMLLGQRETGAVTTGEQ